MRPKYELLKLINMYKNNIDQKENLMKIIECLLPAINKFAKKAYWEEYEDMQQELMIALIEAVNKIETYDNEGKCINFFINAIRNRFYELYRKNKKLKIELNSYEDELENVCDENFNEYLNLEFEIDLNSIIRYSSVLQEQIAKAILIKEMSDREIAEDLGISRQYVNRCKKEIFNMLKGYSFIRKRYIGV